MWGASRLNNALRRQALERLRRTERIKSSGSENSLVDEAVS